MNVTAGCALDYQAQPCLLSPKEPELETQLPYWRAVDNSFPLSLSVLICKMEVAFAV